MFDTVIKGSEVRLLLGPPSFTNDNLFGKVKITGMENKRIDTFVESRISSLKDHNDGFTLLERGKIDIDGIDSRWFSYTRQENAVATDLISYFIPVKGTSYEIVFGVNKGGMDKWRPIFDKMAKSFETFPFRKEPDTIGGYQFGARERRMETGFYFLEEGSRGVRVRKEHSNDMYSLNYLPFASVKNVIKARLFRRRIAGEIYPELNMQFDKKGTKDIQEGTSNSLHAQVAVVVADRLLYVVDNGADIKTGEMLILLEGYSETEMAEMMNTVIQKK